MDMLPQRPDRFRENENGAVTVDWTTLAAAIVGFGVVAVTAVSCGANNLAWRTGLTLGTAEVNQLDNMQDAAGGQ